MTGNNRIDGRIPAVRLCQERTYMIGLAEGIRRPESIVVRVERGIHQQQLHLAPIIVVDSTHIPPISGRAVRGGGEVIRADAKRTYRIWNDVSAEVMTALRPAGIFDHRFDECT